MATSRFILPWVGKADGQLCESRMEFISATGLNRKSGGA